MFLRLLALTVNPVLGHPLSAAPHHLAPDRPSKTAQLSAALAQGVDPEFLKSFRHSVPLASVECPQQDMKLHLPRRRLHRRPQRGDRGLRGAGDPLCQPGRSRARLAGPTGGGLRACTGGGIRPPRTDGPAGGAPFGHAGHLSRISLRLASGNFSARSFARSKSLAFTASSAVANRLSESGLPTLRSAISRV